MKKKIPSYFERRLDEIYNVEKVLREEGHEAAERSYLKIVALLLLFIDDSMRSIRLFFSALTGCAAGLFIGHLLKMIVESL